MHTDTYPLTGIRVLDFTSNVSGPYATQLLVELGAQVVKVEPPWGDDGRRLTPTREGFSAVFEAVNRGKHSIVIDLKQPAGRDLALRLAAQVDVVAENLRPGAMEKLGLGFTHVSAVNRSVIYLSISGFGRTGPLASRPGYDMVMQARSGLISMTGEPDRKPVRVGVSVVDFGTGPWAALAILAALRLRDQNVGPQHLDMSLYDVAVNWATLPLTQYTIAGQLPRRMGGQTAMGAPADIYPTASGYLVVAVVNEPLWIRFCRAASLTRLLDDPRFSTNALRSQHRAELSEQLVEHFATDTAAAWARRLQAAGITAEVVADVESLLDDPQAAARSRFVEVHHPVLGNVIAAVTPPLGNSDWQAAGHNPAPTLGEHSQQVLAEFGVTQAEYRQLLAQGVVHRSPDEPPTE